jgi:hypothetical protein
MNTTLLLRISSVISFLFTLGHMSGGLQEWSPMDENAVFTAMRTVRFDVMGASRSYHDFYMGFGHSISIAMLLQSVLLWQLASVTKAGTVSVGPMILAFALASAASTVVAWWFIIPIPALFSLALTGALVLAFVSTRRRARPEGIPTPDSRR